MIGNILVFSKDCYAYIICTMVCTQLEQTDKHIFFNPKIEVYGFNCSFLLVPPQRFGRNISPPLYRDLELN